MGAGIRLKRIAADFREIDVEMKLRWWNANYVRTQFGGSLYMMTDPFYMLMLMEILGPNYIVWDKASTVRFKKPGRMRVRASFRLTDERLQEIRKALETQAKIEPIFEVQILDAEGTLIAEVEKLLYLRKKEKIEK